MIAFAWRAGLIEFGTECPDGAVPFCEIDEITEAEMREIVECKARHAYNGKDLLVPGVPEATSDEAAAEALWVWAEWAFPEGRKLALERAKWRF